MTRTRALALGFSAAASLLAIACGSALGGTTNSDAASSGGASSSGGSSSGASGTNPAPFSDAGAVDPSRLADAVFLVHAASFPPFRMCFANDGGKTPTPNRDVMPNSNVVGVEVGAAVRLPPLVPAGKPTLGAARLYEESKIRKLYPPNVTGPSCDDLLSASVPSIDVGAVDESLASGIHVLALVGCRASKDDVAASKDRCGATWTPEKGNLSLQRLEIGISPGTGGPGIPTQTLLLSSALATKSAGRRIGLSFGTLAELGGGGAIPAPFVDDLAVGMVRLGSALTIANDDAGVYASEGLALGFGDGAADAGKVQREVAFTQSLADVQHVSAPDAIPDAWFGVGGAGFLLVVVGDPDPRLPDGNPDSDPAHRPHVLALPLVTVQEADAGTDGGR